jgi:hypothetical protein
MKVLPINSVNKVDDYPYGRLKATVEFSLEFKSGSGFRSVFQSVNPKTGRINKPKKSIYYNFMFQYVEDLTGHIKTSSHFLNSKKDVKKLLELLTKNEKDLDLSKEHICYLCGLMFTVLKFDLFYEKMKEKPEPLVVKEIEDAMVLLLGGFKSGLIEFIKVIL